MLLTIHLGLPQHLKKFLISKFGEEYHLSREDFLGILISSLLEKKSTGQYPYKLDKEKYSEKYLIHISLSYAQKNGIYLIQEHEALIRRSVENIFRNNLYEQALINKECYGIDYKTTFLNTLEFYGISEDNKSYFQMLMRDFNRKKEGIKSKKTEIKIS